MLFVLILIISYLAGSVNFSIILFKILGKDDPRKGYSGNPGTTNVYRQAGPGWAALVLLLDAGRAIAVSLIARHILSAGSIPWAGLALIAGNRYPCFHGFRGGKGVASYIGFTAPVSPAGTIVACIAWVVVYLVKRIPFIASFAAIAVLGTATSLALDCRPGAVIGSLATVLFIVINHWNNIAGFSIKKKDEIIGDDDTA